MYIDTHHSLSQLASSLLPLPPTSQSYLLSLYTLTLERDALLSQAELHADYRLQSCERQFELEKEQLDTEYQKARNGVKATLLDRIEERRRRCRDERDALDVVGQSLPSLPARGSLGCGRPLPSAQAGQLLSQPRLIALDADPSPLPPPTAPDSHLFPAIPAGPLLQLPATLANAVGTPPASSFSAASASTSTSAGNGSGAGAGQLQPPPSTNGGVNRSLRQSRHGRGPSYRSSTPGGGSGSGIATPGGATEAGDGADAGGPLSTLSEAFAPPSALSLSILNHPSLSKNSLAANLFSFASAASASGKKARHHHGHPSSSSSSAANGGPGGGAEGPTLPGQGIFDRPPADSSKDDRMFVYTPGKSLADLGKVVKSSELEIDWDLDQIRRTWKGGVLMGNVRGRRGAAVRAEALTAAGAGR